MTGQTKTPFAPVEVIVSKEFSCPCCQQSRLHVDTFLSAALDTGISKSGSASCRKCFSSFEVKAEGGVLSVSQVLEGKNREPFVDVFVLMRSTNNDGKDPIHLVVQASHPLGTVLEHQTTGQSGLDFLYEDHTCPTNWLKDSRLAIRDGRVTLIPYALGIKMVSLDADPDPHGVFKIEAVVSFAQAARMICASADYHGEPCDEPWEEQDEYLYIPFRGIIEGDKGFIEGEKGFVGLSSDLNLLK